MPSPPKQFDVWFVAANTVYKQVPYQVVADWVQQGRLGAADMLRPAGMNDPWKAVQQWELLADYLPRAATPQAAPVVAAVAVGAAPAAPAGEPEEGSEHVEDDFRPRIRRQDDDDDVDMIPLIDISMVLLVFFIIMRAAGALAPVDVPDMRYGGELSKDQDAITISIEKANEETVIYAVRVGRNPSRPEHSNLANPEAALAALDSILLDLRSNGQRAPEVRVACQKDLPSERVFEMSRELKKRRDQNLINNAVATVNEAPKQ